MGAHTSSRVRMAPSIYQAARRCRFVFTVGAPGREGLRRPLGSKALGPGVAHALCLVIPRKRLCGEPAVLEAA